MKNYNSTLQSNNLDLQAILDTINALPEAGGVELPALANAGTAADLLKDKQLIDGEGNVVTGSFNIDDELSEQAELMVQMQDTLNSLPETGNVELTGTCSLTIYTSASFEINKIWYSSNGAYVGTENQNLFDVDINQPIFICRPNSTLEIDYYDNSNVEILEGVGLKRNDQAVVIIRCLRANQASSITFSGTEVDEL